MKISLRSKDYARGSEQESCSKDLSLTVKHGEFVAVTGASGCGKTTLLNMIGGLEPYDSGTIRVDGIDVGKRKNRAYFYSNVIGFLFQNYVLMEDRSVRENLNIIRQAPDRI